MKCQCNGKRLTCLKKACPMLQCPPHLQYTPPGSCCPKCTKNITYQSIKGGCLMMGEFFPSAKDKKVKPDKCSICTCHNETSHCVKRTCPVLECSPEHQVYRDGECCPTCPDLVTELSSSTCTYKGVTYQVRSINTKRNYEVYLSLSYRRTIKHGTLDHVNHVSVVLERFDVHKPSVKKLNVDPMRISSFHKVNVVLNVLKVQVKSHSTSQMTIT